MNNGQNEEIELKLRVDNLNNLENKLQNLGARLIKSIHQKDLLFDAIFAKFDQRDQALRLRIETDNQGRSRSIFGFKGTPIDSEKGLRSRPEYETEVEDPEKLQKILEAIGFYVAIVLEKGRNLYEADGVEIAVDKFDFGTFVEIEGLPDQIEIVRGKLELFKTEPITKGYIQLWAEIKNIDLKSLRRY